MQNTCPTVIVWFIMVTYQYYNYVKTKAWTSSSTACCLDTVVVVVYLSLVWAHWARHEDNTYTVFLCTN